jgi:hypothetical protein
MTYVSANYSPTETNNLLSDDIPKKKSIINQNLKQMTQSSSIPNTEHKINVSTLTRKTSVP